MIEQKKKPIGILLTVILISALLTVCLELGLSYLRPDTPGLLTKHLIHFAIMFILFGGATLLCLFCPPIKKLWAWLDKHITSQETRPIAIDIIYAALAGLMLLHHFYVLLYYPTIPAGATKFAPVWIVFAAFTVILGKSWREISFYLAAIFLVFTFDRLYIENPAITGETAVYFSSAIYALFICLGAFSALRPSVRKPFLQALCALWTVGMVAMCIPGLYTAWTGINLHNLAGTVGRIIKGRLRIFTPAPMTAGNLGCGIIMAFTGFAISKKKIVKVLYLLSALVAIITNSLTDSRSSFLMIAFMIAGMLHLSIWTIYHRQNSKCSGRKNVLVVVSLAICFGLCFFLVVEGQRYLATSFVSIRDNGGIIIPAARAADNQDTLVPEPTATPKPREIKQREVWISEESDINSTLNGRYKIWQRGIGYIKKHPETLLFGLSVDGSVTSVIDREDHSHNILLQTLLEGGLPALFLYLALIIYGLFHAFRIWRQIGIPFWKQLLPLPVFAILLWEMAECLSHFSYGHPPMTLFWFFLGATITMSKSLRKPSDTPTRSTTITAGE